MRVVLPLLLVGCVGALVFYWLVGTAGPGSDLPSIAPSPTNVTPSKPSVAVASPRPTPSTSSDVVAERPEVRPSVAPVANSNDRRATGANAADFTHAAGVAAVELGWSANDPRARIVARWNAGRMQTQRRIFRGVVFDEDDHEKDDAIRAFHDNSERLRRELIDSLGAPVATKVLTVYRLHRWDERNRCFVRLLADGRTAPVGHDDEVPDGYDR